MLIDDHDIFFDIDYLTAAFFVFCIKIISLFIHERQSKIFKKTKKIKIFERFGGVFLAFIVTSVYNCVRSPNIRPNNDVKVNTYYY